MKLKSSTLQADTLGQLKCWHPTWALLHVPPLHCLPSSLLTRLEEQHRRAHVLQERWDLRGDPGLLQAPVWLSPGICGL